MKTIVTAMDVELVVKRFIRAAAALVCGFWAYEPNIGVGKKPLLLNIFYIFA